MSETPALRGIDLRLGYHGRTVVDGGEITLSPGQVTALVGPNGSGKSTLLRSLARLHRPDAGEVRLPASKGENEESAWGLSASDFARRVTLLTQNRPTPGGVSVRDVVGYGRHPYRGWRGRDLDGPRAIEWAMTVTGVRHMADRAVNEVSGGELQRVWLATCLAQNTAVLLLDEPTTFLDLRYQVEILDLVRDLADEHDIAVGVVLHDLNQAAAVADEVVLLHEGRVRAAGPPAEVLTSEALTETYGIEVEVSVDPLTRTVHMRPVSRHAQRLATV